MASSYQVFEFEKPAQGEELSSALIRRLLRALAQTNITDDVNYPANPERGMLRFNVANPSNVKLEVYWNSSWVTLVQGVGGVGSAARHLTSSYSAQVTWTFDHNLGKKPLVQCINASGVVVLPSSITHVSDNRVVVVHGTATSGTMVVVG